MVNIPALYEGSDTQYRQLKLEQLYDLLLDELGDTGILLVPDSSNDQKTTFITRKKHASGLNATFTWDSAPTLTHEGVMHVWAFDGLATEADSPDADYWSCAADRITNGDFAADSDWTKNSWTISTGKARATTVSDDLEQTPNIPLIEGISYTVTFTTERSAGDVTVKVGGTSGTTRSTAATFTETIVAGSGSLIEFTGNGFTGTIDDVTMSSSMSFGGMVNFTDATSSDIFTKWDATTSAELREFRIGTDSSDRILIQIYDEINNASIGRRFNTSLTEGIWYHLTGVFDGGTDAANISIYLNATKVDDSNHSDGAGFISTQNTATVIAIGYQEGASGTKIQFFDGLMGIMYFTQALLTVAKIKNIDRLLNAAMGLI